MKTKFMWTKFANRSFERLKKEVETQPILVLPIFEKAFVVECDASKIEIREILS